MFRLLDLCFSDPCAEFHSFELKHMVESLVHLTIKAFPSMLIKDLLHHHSDV